MKIKVAKYLLIVLIAFLNTGCVSSWLSIGEEASQCDKNTKKLGQCAGISDIMKNKYKYTKEYLKGGNNEQ